MKGTLSAAAAGRCGRQGHARPGPVDAEQPAGRRVRRQAGERVEVPGARGRRDRDRGRIRSRSTEARVRRVAPDEDGVDLAVVALDRAGRRCVRRQRRPPLPEVTDTAALRRSAHRHRRPRLRARQLLRRRGRAARPREARARHERRRSAPSTSSTTRATSPRTIGSAGFSQLHLHGTGATDYGVLSLMPTLAFDPSKTKVTDYETRFAKDDEHVAAGYYERRRSRAASTSS